MGTLRRDVTRLFGAIGKMLGLARGKPAIPPQKKQVRADEPVVKGFTPYFGAYSMSERMQHAERATERWFQDVLYSMAPANYRRPRFYSSGSEIHYVHKGHRHAAARRKRQAARKTVDRRRAACYNSVAVEV